MSELFLAVFGTSGVLWAIIAARRKRPALKLKVLAMGPHHTGTPGAWHLFLHCKVDNTSSEPNSIREAHLGFLNKRESELIWNHIGGKLYLHDIKTNYIGKKIGPSLKLPAKSSKEFIAVFETSHDVIQRYIGNGPSLFRDSAKQEKPFQYRLYLIDSHGNAFTGTLTGHKSGMVDYRRLQYLDRLRIDLSNDNMYARPRLRHLWRFYAGNIRLRIIYRLKKVLYELGVLNSTQ